MSNYKQSSVEWLINNHFGGIENCTPDFRKKIEQAKEIEKEQSINDFISGMEFIAVDPNRYKEDAEQYYNETYGGNK